MAKKEVINKLFNSVWFVILIGVLLLGKTFLFYHNTIAINEPLEMETMIGTACFMAVMICFLTILPNRTRIITAIVIDFLVSLLLFADHVYYVFSNSVISVAQITNLQYGEEIAGTLPMVMQVKQILYFLDMMVLIGLGIGKVIKWEKYQLFLPHIEDS